MCLICILSTILYYLDITEIPTDKAEVVPGGKSMLKLNLHENRAAQVLFHARSPRAKPIPLSPLGKSRPLYPL